MTKTRGRKPDLPLQRRIAALRQQGLTLPQIGQRLGMTKQAVHQFLLAYQSRRQRLTLAQVLKWAGAYRQRTGSWPKYTSGRIPGTGGLNWRSIENALRYGLRGLAGGSTLAQLLQERRGVRNAKRLSPLTEDMILVWADAYRGRTGKWPTEDSGRIPKTPGEIWQNVCQALRDGTRGLAGRTTLSRLLAECRSVRNRAGKPPLTVPQILRWADAHHLRTGHWPKVRSGRVEEAPGETWAAIEAALEQGCRGLPGDSSLAQLLTQHRGVRNYRRPPRLTHRKIVEWAAAHHDRTGKWPTAESGPIADAPGETWGAVQMALVEGRRGLHGDGSLSRFLKHHRGIPGRSVKQ